jgi:intraflagellar transport protein 172
MYKRVKNYDSMLKLIKEYHPDLLNDTYAHLAKVRRDSIYDDKFALIIYLFVGFKEIEQTGNSKQAENYYVNAGDWKSAVNMYRRLDMWEDSFRVGLSFLILI